MDTLAPILHKISYMALPLLFAMVFHEFAHGWLANKCGDPTAKLQGRLTLNPMAHIDPLGTVILPLICLALPGSFLLGWAKPIPVDPRNMGQPRRDMALVVANSVNSDALTASLRNAAPAFVRAVEVFDVYRGAGLPEGKKSVAIRVLMQDTERTLADNEIEGACQRMLENAQQQHGAALRA